MKEIDMKFKNSEGTKWKQEYQGGAEEKGKDTYVGDSQLVSNCTQKG